MNNRFGVRDAAKVQVCHPKKRKSVLGDPGREMWASLVVSFEIWANRPRALHDARRARLRLSARRDGDENGV
jgi:hypothetical protein